MGETAPLMTRDPAPPPLDARAEQLRSWLERDLGLQLSGFAPASSDASFRRYFRAWYRDGTTAVVMDAPPARESTAPFLHAAGLLEHCGVHVPRIDAVDVARGFILLEDLGSEDYLSQLRGGADRDRLYGDALESLLRIQLRGLEPAKTLPSYDREVLEREMQLMPVWFCERHLRLELDAEQRALMAAAFEFLTLEALAQPVVLVHRDYHSRNLMLTRVRNPGIIDFQDALAGPVGYDLVSLLKDCYIQWPRALVEQWVSDYRGQLAAAGGPAGDSAREFLRWFDLIGLQRHLKVLGIFARLWYRDGKPGYLADLPLTLGYVLEAARGFEPLRHFGGWLERVALPALEAANARELGAAAAAARRSPGP
jgi:aminoglycoside/choline kinase family phosphotransferase